MALAIRFDPADDVAVVRSDVAAGEEVDAGEARVTAVDDVPGSHKIALVPIAEGDEVRRYGQVIGFATRPIAAGEHVHTHNLEFRSFARAAEPGVDVRPALRLPEEERASFRGIVRADGRVATRNYVGVLTSVNCSATAARLVAKRFESGLLRDFPNVDGVVALTHGTGCALPPGEGLEILRRTLRGYALHPNFGAVVVLGLGCEVNQLDELLEPILGSAPLLTAMTIQDQGGTLPTVEAAVEAIATALPRLDDVERTTVPAASLLVGMECGGSDAYSGITANPAVGAAADLLVAHGATVVFSETPEIYGAEHLLVRRSASPAVAEKLLERIAWWEDYTSKNGATMDNNPAPGNKAGGLTTILEKSLGAIAKGGTTPLVEVVEYAEPIAGGGLVFMDTPGYDPASVTGMVAGGANVVCFTTGRGSAFGCKPVPSIKVASNPELFRRMRDDMDVDAGRIVEGEASVADVGREIFELVLEVASGAETKSELLDVGQDEFVPWSVGAVM